MASPYRGDEFVQPTNPDAAKRASTGNEVVLYFINFKIVELEGERRGFVKGGGQVMSRVDGRVYQLPPIGESLRVGQRVAEDLMQRTRIYDNVHGWFDGFTTSQAIAESVKAAFDRGDLDYDEKTKADGTILTFQDILNSSMTRSTLDGMSVEDLEAELAARKKSQQKSKRGAAKADGE